MQRHKSVSKKTQTNNMLGVVTSDGCAVKELILKHGKILEGRKYQLQHQHMPDTVIQFQEQGNRATHLVQAMHVLKLMGTNTLEHGLLWVAEHAEPIPFTSKPRRYSRDLTCRLELQRNTMTLSAKLLGPAQGKTKVKSDDMWAWPQLVQLCPAV
jgi:hypothetical protein